MLLPVAHSAVVEACVAGDVRHRPIAFDPVPGRADHHGEFALEVKPIGHARLAQRLAVSDLRIGEAGEHQRVIWPGRIAARLVEVGGDAQDFARVGDGRQQLHRG